VITLAPVLPRYQCAHCIDRNAALHFCTMNRVIIFLLTLSLTLFAVSQTRKSPWKEMIYASDGFAITVPYPPLPHADATIPDTNAYTIYLPGESDIGLTLRVMKQYAEGKGWAEDWKDMLTMIEARGRSEEPVWLERAAWLQTEAGSAPADGKSYKRPDHFEGPSDVWPGDEALSADLRTGE
jgi:hypothetical protein